MVNPVAQNPNLVRVPYTNIEFVLTPLDKKVMATALACILLFGVQFCFSCPMTFLITCAITSVIFIFEQAIDREKTDWFNTEIRETLLVCVASILILKPLIIYAFCWALGLPLPGFAQERIKELFLNQPLRTILISCISAPFSEEILFRGVLEERLEDFGHLLNRYTALRVSQQVRDIFTGIAQGLIFGACHLNRKIKEGMKTFVFFTISWMGGIFSVIKRNEKSLIPSITLHSTNNIGVAIYILR